MPRPEMLEVTVANPAIGAAHEEVQQRNRMSLPGGKAELEDRARWAKLTELAELVERKRELQAKVAQLQQAQSDYEAILEILKELGGMILPGEIPVGGIKKPQRWKTTEWSSKYNTLVNRFMSLSINRQASERVVRDMFEDMLFQPDASEVRKSIERYEGYLVDTPKQIEDCTIRIEYLNSAEAQFRQELAAYTKPN